MEKQSNAEHIDTKADDTDDGFPAAGASAEESTVGMASATKTARTARTVE